MSGTPHVDSQSEATPGEKREVSDLPFPVAVCFDDHENISVGDTVCRAAFTISADQAPKIITLDPKYSTQYYVTKDNKDMVPIEVAAAIYTFLKSLYGADGITVIVTKREGEVAKVEERNLIELAEKGELKPVVTATPSA